MDRKWSCSSMYLGLAGYRRIIYFHVDQDSQLLFASLSTMLDVLINVESWWHMIDALSFQDSLLHGETCWTQRSCGCRDDHRWCYPMSFVSYLTAHVFTLWYFGICRMKLSWWSLPWVYGDSEDMQHHEVYLSASKFWYRSALWHCWCDC